MLLSTEAFVTISFARRQHCQHTEQPPQTSKLLTKFITEQFIASSNCYLKNGNDGNWREKVKALFGEFLMAVKLSSCVKHHVPKKRFCWKIGKNNTSLSPFTPSEKNPFKLFACIVIMSELSFYMHDGTKKKKEKEENGQSLLYVYLSITQYRLEIFLLGVSFEGKFIRRKKFLSKWNINFSRKKETKEKKLIDV